MGPLFVLGIVKDMKSKALTTVEQLIEPVIAALGYEFVGVEYSPQGRQSLLRIYIDNPDGITVDDCERVSRQVSAVLDVEDPIQGQYRLEVSSPGLDRPLFTLEQFSRFVGKTVKLRLVAPKEGRRNFSGTLKQVDNESVMIEQDGEDLALPFGQIDKAHLVPEM